MEMIKLLVVPTMVLLPYFCLAQLSIEWSQVFGGSLDENIIAIAIDEEHYEAIGYTNSTDVFFEGLDTAKAFWINGNLSDGSAELLFTDFDINAPKPIDVATGFSVFTKSKALLADTDYSSNLDYLIIKNLNLQTPTETSITDIYPMPSARLPNALVKGIEKQYWIVGQTGNRMVNVHKLDEVEGYLWEKNYGGSDNEWGIGLVPLADGSVVIAAHSSSDDGNVGQNMGLTDPWLFKLNPDGQILWSKVLGTENPELVRDIQATSDGGFVLLVLESTFSNDVISSKGKLLKTDGEGVVEWIYESPFSSTESFFFRKVLALSSGHFLIAGHQSFSTETNEDLVFQLVDPDGTLLWSQNFGGSGGDYIEDIEQIDAQSFLVSASTYSTDGDVPENSGFLDAWLFKLRLDETISSNASVKSTTNDWNLSPNPVEAGQELIFERIGAIGSEEIIIELFNATGLIIARKRLGANGNKLGYRLPESIPSGSYWIRIRTGNTLAIKSVLVVD